MDGPLRYKGDGSQWVKNVQKRTVPAGQKLRTKRTVPKTRTKRTVPKILMTVPPSPCHYLRNGGSMFRYFCADDNIKNDMIRVQGGDARHLKTILRAKSGDRISVVTQSKEYIAEIKEVNKENIVCALIEEILSNNETKINITLCQGIPKQTKMDTIIQQNVEMGVKRFIPLITERTVVKLNEKEREQKKLDRWQKIAKESAKQSKRNIIPSIEPIMTLEELIEKLRREEDAAVIVPYELEDVKQLKDILCEQRDNYYIVIGPEGGFDIKEIEMFQEIGAHIVTLGKRILRTETAGVVTAAIVLYACNELN
jgi:16S rRNA (uracil1498-N3)-methyltransferase